MTHYNGWSGDDHGRRLALEFDRKKILRAQLEVQGKTIHPETSGFYFRVTMQSQFCDRHLFEGVVLKCKFELLLSFPKKLLEE